MKVLHLSTWDMNGGAFIAAYRTHRALLCEGVDSIMYVMKKFNDDPTVVTVDQTVLKKIMDKMMNKLSWLVSRFFRSENSVMYSPELFSEIDLDFVDKINPDIINMNWVCANFIKPKDLIRLSKRPLVWTMHDMWPFTGTEHYTAGNKRYEEIYSSSNRPEYEKGLDLCKIVWKSKDKAYSRISNMTLVSPSVWLADCARKSTLLKRFPVSVIPNGLDTEIFKPRGKRESREALGLPQDSFLILFGGNGGTNSPRKGFIHLKGALESLTSNNGKKIGLVVFGEGKPKDSPEDSFPSNYLGIINDEKLLSKAYSAADVFVIPTTEDNLPNTILESLSCGTPVVGFNIGGIPDAVTHGYNGYLAKPFDEKDLALGILSFMNKTESECRGISINARDSAEKKFSLMVLAKNYLCLYDKLIK